MHNLALCSWAQNTLLNTIQAVQVAGFCMADPTPPPLDACGDLGLVGSYSRHLSLVITRTSVASTEDVADGTVTFDRQTTVSVVELQFSRYLTS
jgi:hypothetical protein